MVESQTEKGMIGGQGGKVGGSHALEVALVLGRVAGEYANVGVPAVADRPGDADEEKREALEKAKAEERAFGDRVRGSIA